MPVSTETLNRKLYKVLSKYKPKPLDSSSNVTPVEDEADVFGFTFVKDGVAYGDVFATIDDDRVLKLYYGDDVSNSPSAPTSGLDYNDSWEGLLEFLGSWAHRNRVKWEPNNNKDHLVRDMARRKHMKKKEQIGEGYYPMGKKASYSDNIPTVKIVIEHTRQIEEGEQRYRNINKIFLENQLGERFLLDTKKPGVARVYARHIAEGGKVNDDRWGHISSLCEEYNKMAGFVRATRNGQFNESAQKLVESGIQHYQSLRETLSRMTGKRGYNMYFENWTPALMEDEVEETNLNELFVQETLDPRIENVMPILSKLQKQVSEMKETVDLAEWADSLIEGGDGGEASEEPVFTEPVETLPADGADAPVDALSEGIDSILAKHHDAVENFKQGGDMGYDLESDLWDYYFTNGDIKNYDADASEFITMQLADYLGIDEGLGDFANKIGGALKTGAKAVGKAIVGMDDDELMVDLKRRAGVRNPENGKPSMAQSDVEKRTDEVDMGQADSSLRSQPKQDNDKMDHFTALGKASKKMGHDHFMDVPDDKLEALKAMVKRFRAGEEVDESAHGYEPIAHAIEQYITKHYNGKSGLDTDDFMKVASMVRNGSINAARKFASTLDTDPRDKLLSMLGQGVAEESSENKYSNLSNRGVNRGINRAGDDFNRMMDLDQVESPHYKTQHQQDTKQRLKTKPMAGPHGYLPEQGVAEGYQLDEGAIETITALAKKIPGIGKYYQMAQQYKPQLIEILKTSKSGKEVKQKMEQLAAGQSATVAESGMMKQLGGLAVGGGSILSTMWMNAMGMIDGVLAHAAAGEVGGAVASGSILGLIPVTLMLFAAMLMFKGSNQSSDEKAQAFQAQRGQQGVAEGEGMLGRSKYDKRYLDKFDPTEVMNISDDPEMKAHRTTRQGSLRTSKKDLEFAFGSPGEDDTWVLEFRNGLIATIYPQSNSGGMDWFIGGNHPDIEDYVLKAYSAAIDDLEEGLDADQKRVGQLGPTSKVKNNNIGKLVGANENFINTVDQAVVSEMDKSQTPPGRDDDVKGPEGKATPIAPKKMADDAKKVLDKQKVKEGQEDLDRILIIMNHRR
jgi:hypothetical protein